MSGGSPAPVEASVTAGSAWGEGGGGTLVGVPGGPEVVLLDARAEGLDWETLRARARGRSGELCAAHVSRSYSYPFALLALHDQPVGVDIEQVEACDEAFARSICTPEEVAGLGDVGEGDRDRRITSLWSSKEALAKALGDALDYDPRRLGSPAFWADGRAGRWRAMPLPLPAGHVGWLCWCAADQRP